MTLASAMLLVLALSLFAVLARLDPADWAGGVLHQLAVAMLPALIIAAGMLCSSPGHHDADWPAYGEAGAVGANANKPGRFREHLLFGWADADRARTPHRLRRATKRASSHHGAVPDSLRPAASPATHTLGGAAVALFGTCCKPIS